jgi:hypothetical protein
VPGLGIELTFVASDRAGGAWAFDLSGAFTTNRTGLGRADVLWKALGKAAVLHQRHHDLALVLLTTDAPTAGSAALAAVDALRGPGRPVLDLVELLEPGDQERLRQHAQGRQRLSPT